MVYDAPQPTQLNRRNVSPMPSRSNPARHMAGADRELHLTQLRSLYGQTCQDWGVKGQKRPQTGAFREIRGAMRGIRSKQLRRSALAVADKPRSYMKHKARGYVCLEHGCTRDVYQAIKALYKSERATHLL